MVGQIETHITGYFAEFGALLSGSVIPCDITEYNNE